MSDLNVEISGYVAGDDLTVRRTVMELPSPIEHAWLTVKRHVRLSDEDAVIAKHITTDEQEGIGCIETAGGGETAGVIRFDLTQDDTNALGAATWVYDIQIKLENGVVYTTDKGRIELTQDVTQTTEPGE